MIPSIAQVIGILSILTLVTSYLRLYPKRRKSSADYRHSGTVISVSFSSKHLFSKTPTDSITLLENLGVEGDCHCGATVQHRSRLHIKPTPANLRQVHLIPSELFQEFKSPGPDGGGKKYIVRPGDLGENITTEGLDLLAMGAGTKLHFLNSGIDGIGGEEHAIVRVTGLRNPCPQISNFQPGLQERCLVRDAVREIVQRKAGIMTVVDVGGIVRKGARIVVERPEIYEALSCV